MTENNRLLCYQYKRNKINQWIREMSVQYGVAFKDAYNTLYSEFTKQSGTDIHILYKTYTGKSKMDVMEEFEPTDGYLTKFYVL